jgi:hypothetical protein
MANKECGLQLEQIFPFLGNSYYFARHSKRTEELALCRPSYCLVHERYIVRFVSGACILVFYDVVTIPTAIDRFLFQFDNRKTDKEEDRTNILPDDQFNYREPASMQERRGLCVPSPGRKGKERLRQVVRY